MGVGKVTWTFQREGAAWPQGLSVTVLLGDLPGPLESPAHPHWHRSGCSWNRTVLRQTLRAIQKLESLAMGVSQR